MYYQHVLPACTTSMYYQHTRGECAILVIHGGDPFCWAVSRPFCPGVSRRFCWAVSRRFPINRGPFLESQDPYRTHAKNCCTTPSLPSQYLKTGVLLTRMVTYAITIITIYSQQVGTLDYWLLHHTEDGKNVFSTQGVTSSVSSLHFLLVLSIVILTWGFWDLMVWYHCYVIVSILKY